jgi:hypothetical protein
VEVGDVDGVLDGNLEPFIRGYLLMRRQGGAGDAGIPVTPNGHTGGGASGMADDLDV